MVPGSGGVRDIGGPLRDDESTRNGESNTLALQKVA